MRSLLLLGWLSLSLHANAYEARVLIDESSPSQIVSGEFRMRCLAPESVCSKKVYIIPNAKWQLIRHAKGVKIKNLETGQLNFLKGTRFQITGSFALQGRMVQRLVFDFAKKQSQWVLHLPVDQYLYGVMAAEVPASWPLESLKAQAIASRTYFLYKKKERSQEIFDVRSNTMDQVFRMDAKKQVSIKKAVDQTHGDILVSKKGEIFPAYFHSDCGGGTSSENKVWRKPSSLNKPVPDPYCKTASKNNWTYFIDRSKFLSLLHQVFYLPQGVELKSILPRIQSSHRAHIVDFIFSNDIIKRMSANELRKLLGFGKLKSTSFAVESSWRDIIFTGRGFGHGVGMCQWGAQRWARKGKSYRSILKHYYPDAKIRKVDSKTLQAQLSF